MDKRKFAVTNVKLGMFVTEYGQNGEILEYFEILYNGNYGK